MGKLTAYHYPQSKLNLLWLVLGVILLSLSPRVAFAQDAAGQEVVAAINQARAENGLSPLSINPLLNQAAQNHVDDMITNYVYGHYGSDGSSVHVRVARTGYSDKPWVSENWVSARDVGGAMRWWMGDYIHRVNILTAHWVEVGVGVGTRGSEMIFVTVFSAGSGSSNDTAAIAAGTPPQGSPPPPSVHIEQLSVPPEGLDYTVQPGDTLLAIGLRYGLPWERIAEANGLNETSLLQIGQVVRVPGSGTPPGPPPPEVKTEDYTVQPNDTLFSIAAKRGMYWEDVAVVNGYGEHTVLQIGQVIQVPVVEEVVAPETTLLVNTRQATVGPVPAEAGADDFENYTLMTFDPAQSTQADGSQVAMAQTGVGGPSTEVTQVAMAMDEGAGATSTVLAQYAQQQASSLYVVEPGDTIISIAGKHNIEWGQLLSLNGLNENSVLQPGQTIHLR
jgi:LysM repeat protein